MENNYQKLLSKMDFGNIPNDFVVLCTKTYNNIIYNPYGDKILDCIVTESVSKDKGLNWTKEKIVNQTREIIDDEIHRNEKIIKKNDDVISIYKFNEKGLTTFIEDFSVKSRKLIKTISYTYNENGKVISEEEIRYFENYPKDYIFGEGEKDVTKTFKGYHYTNSGENIKQINIYEDDKLVETEINKYTQLKDGIIMCETEFSKNKGYNSLAESYFIANAEEDFLSRNLFEYNGIMTTGGYNLNCKINNSLTICEDYIILHKDSCILKMK